MIGRRYRVERKIGDGATAEVFLAYDTVLNRFVAIKLLRTHYAADRGFRLRFEREAQQAARLTHPNVVAIFDVGEEKGLPFLVMEYVDGQPLDEIIREEAPLHPDDVAILVEQVASALDEAHRRGLIHRDIKPQNVLVDRQGVAKVADFGIAKGVADAAMTDSGLVTGTAAYVSPEQASGLIATPESDVYSLAVVAYEMLTGRVPFERESAMAAAIAHVNDAPPDPSDLNPGVPSEVADIVLRGLAKNPTQRFHSAGEFARTLSGWAHYHPEDWRAARDRARSTSQFPAVRPKADVIDSASRVDSASVPPPLDADPRGESSDRDASGRILRPRNLALLILPVALIASWRIASSGHGAQSPTATPSVRIESTARIVVRQTPAPTAAPSATSAPQPPAVDLTGLDLIGRPADDASAALTAAGLSSTRVDEGSLTVPLGSVIRIDPASSAPAGSTVSLVVSVGDKVRIPFDLQGQPSATVERALTDLGLTVAGSIGVSAQTIQAAGVDLAANDIEDGDVVGVQDNGATFGAWVERGVQVTLVIYDASLGETVEPTIQPNT